MFASDDCEHIASTAALTILPSLTEVTSIKYKAIAEECVAATLMGRLLLQNQNIITDLAMKTGHVDEEPDPDDCDIALPHLHDHFPIPSAAGESRFPLLRNLKSFRLTNLVPGPSGVFLARMVGSRTLEELRLTNCDGPAQFLDELANIYGGDTTCRLKVVELTWHEEVLHQVDAVRGALTRLLLAFKGLEKLFVINQSVNFSSTILPRHTILHHADTLKALLLDEPYWKIYLTADELENICKSCPNLQHLGLCISLPDVKSSLHEGDLGRYLVRFRDIRDHRIVLIAYRRRSRLPQNC